jgi:hypothetical protein
MKVGRKNWGFTSLFGSLFGMNEGVANATPSFIPSK